MATELKDINVQQYKQDEKQELREIPAMETFLNTLARSGGFDFLEAVVDGADNMNPYAKQKEISFSQMKQKTTEGSS